MLTHLGIQHFTIVTRLDLDVAAGMTAITGETGAGKSIMFDALSLALGSRAEAKMVRAGETRCDIHAHFDISQLPAVQKWLNHHELNSDDECILRRTITADGRSRSYVNGHATPLQLTRQLGHLLINICGQHEQHGLFKRDYQLKLLDNFANTSSLLKEIKTIHQQWVAIQHELKALQASNDAESRLELLRYQIEELNTLDVQNNELEDLEIEHKQLANAENIMATCQEIIALSENDEASLVSALHSITYKLQGLQKVAEDLQPAQELFNNAIIQIEEGNAEIQAYLDRMEISPERLHAVENRLQRIYDIARKHHVKASALAEHHQQLVEECNKLEGSEERIIELEKQAVKLELDFLNVGAKLSKCRKAAASKLAQQVSKHIQQLGMPNGEFTIVFQDVAQRTPNLQGLETLDFLITTNPGQPAQPLNKVASGGELSRVSLAIQVIAAKAGGTPTLLFDEVDVGIGGGTAEIVGRLLKELGNSAQVICVTHQPQVASQAHHHYRVEKQVKNASTSTSVSILKGADKVSEIARMLGGLELTEQTLAHAQEMLGVE